MKAYLILWGVQAARAHAGCNGDRSFASAQELVQIRDCVRFSGALSFNFMEQGAVDLPNLTGAGDVTIKGPGVEKILFASLERADRVSVLDTPNLTQVSFPRLERAAELSLVLTGQLAAVGLEPRSDGNAMTGLPRIAGIENKAIGSLRFDSNPKLMQVSLPRLKKVARNLTLRAPNDAFTFAAPMLETVAGDLVIDGGDSIQMPSLASVGGHLFLTHLKTEEIDLPIETVGRSFVVVDCPNLFYLMLHRLASVGGHLEVNNTPSLGGIKLGDLRTVGGEILIHTPSARDLLVNFHLKNTKRTTIVARTFCDSLRRAYHDKLTNLICFSTMKPGEENLSALTFW